LNGVIEHIAIKRIGHRGDGVADGADGPVYVPGTLPGETAEVESVPGQPNRRQLLAIEKPSPQRIAPICPHFGICGGCALQHWQTEAYRAWKRDLVIEALHQAGIDAPVAALIDAHGEGRRRVVFHARKTHDVLEVGFSAARAHRLIAIDRCPVLADSLDGALKAAWAAAEALGPVKKPIDIQATATDQGLDVDLRGSGPLTPQLTAALARIAAQQNLARLTRHGELIAQARAPTLRMGAATVALPTAAFLQATAAGEVALARREKRRRPVRRRRAVRVAAGGAGADHRGRRGRRGARRAPTRRRGHGRPKTCRGRAARSVQKSVRCRGA
jgi:23S rRNA (uracil1939-C5)-methyltransferase